MESLSRVGLVFSGGPAPAANAVISAAALAFLDNGVEVAGILDGFSRLQGTDPLAEGKDYLLLDTKISAIRNQPGIHIRTSRANPGKGIHGAQDLRDPKKTEKLSAVRASLEAIGVRGLVTMGGDDTLKTANYLHLLGLPVVHVPKTIDNDYFGIPWTFGYWTAVDTAQKALLNLKSDADSTNAYFLVELMGRKAGWITYAAGVAGEACDIIAAEDIQGDVDPDVLADRLCGLLMAREKEGRTSGVICIAEGLAERLPDRLKPKEIDQHGNPYYGHVELCRTLAQRASALYKDRTGREKKITPKQIGYETRTARPISYDVVLGSMLGYGAYRLCAEGRYGHMVSVEDNFALKAIPFSDLIDPETLTTRIRLVPRESDLFRLKDALSFPVPGRRDL